MSRVQWAEGWDEERFIGVLRERNGFVRCIGKGLCLYNDHPEDPANGRTCAVGAFIPIECYDPMMEASKEWHSPRKLVRDHSDWFPIIDGNQVVEAVFSLQAAHDDPSREEWSEAKARKWVQAWVGEVV